MNLPESQTPGGPAPDGRGIPIRNLGLELVHATEDAALAAGRFMGLNRPDEADAAAIEAMRRVLNALDIEGQIVIGEEARMGKAYSLPSHTLVGKQGSPAMDIVLDAIDGRRLLAFGQSGAISVAAIAPRGTMWNGGPAQYMEKIVVDAEVGDALVGECLDAPAAWTLSLIARKKQIGVHDLTVFVLDRPRHRSLVDEIRSVGARVMLRMDGDIAGALLAASGDSKVDVLMGIGGVQEGVIAACGVKAMGGSMLGRLAPQSDEERAALQAAGLDTRQVLACSHLVSGEVIYFAATGITDGSLLEGVRYQGQWAETHSLILRRETMSRRYLHARHALGQRS